MRHELRVMRALLPLVSRKPWTLPSIVGLGLLASALEGVGLYLFLPLLNVLVGGAPEMPMHQLFRWMPSDLQVPGLVGLVIASVLAKNAVAYLNSAQFAVVDAAAGHKMRTSLFRGVLKASTGFLDSQPTGRIANALFTETWRAARAMNAFYHLIIDACAVVILLGLLFIISWRTVVFVIPFIAVIVTVIAFLTRRIRLLSERAVEANTLFTKRSWESLSGLPTISTFGRGAYEQERFDAASEAVRRSFLGLQLRSNMIGPTFEVLVAAALGAWIVGLDATGTGLPTLAVFLLVLYRLQPRVGSMIAMRASLADHGAAVFEVNAVEAACLASALPSGHVPIASIRTGIEFEEVSVNYHPEAGHAPALDRVSLTIPRNRTTAIVGRSGSGKTTLIKLLCRSMDPTCGTVAVDGTALPDLNLDEWHARLAIIPQEIYLFSATVAENIAYGRLDATREEIVEAAKIANAHDFIQALPLGYDTEIGERGVRLSGGQRQRVAFARAIVRKPDLLIMDEATNALDSESEDKLHKAIERLGHSLTIVIVAHRLSTIRHADQILVMDRGRIIERGDYRSLMREETLFGAMAKLQALEPVQEAAG